MRRSALASVVAVTLMASNALGGVSPTLESFHVEDKAVRDVLRDLARQFGANIAVQAGVSGKVTGQFANCSLEEILRDLLPQVKASYCISETMVMVGEPGQLRCQSITALRMPFVGTPSGPQALEAPPAVGPSRRRPNRTSLRISASGHPGCP